MSYQLLQLRIDLVLLIVAAIAGWTIALRILQRRNARGEFSTAAALVESVASFGFGLILAETAALALHTADIPNGSILLFRLAIGVGSAVVLLLLLRQRAQIALLSADLRQQAETERKLTVAKQAADEASRAKSDFLAVMSHEIRTPLNALMGFANLLRETRLDPAQRDYVATISGEGSRLTALISDILDLTKIEEGRLVLERLPFAPVETAHEVLRLLSARAAERKLDLRFEAQVVGPLLVAGDPLRFRQVLVNLVDNGIKFTPEGSVTLFLAWTPPVQSGGLGELSVSVKDTGIGIAPDKLNALFQMFMQADSSTTRRYGGTGLGLAICQRLVRLMGGEIAVRSRRGEGSEFSFKLPVASVAAPAETLPEPPAGTPAASRRPRILVVDDMDTNRFLLEVFLRRHGFEPELASGGDEAIRMAAAGTYDAILMDLQMPDTDGFTAARRIRQMETGRRTPILALTASVTKGTREKCLEAGMDDHLTKPLDLKRFKTLLDGFIARGNEAGAPPSTNRT